MTANYARMCVRACIHLCECERVSACVWWDQIMVHVIFNLNHLFNFSSHDGSQIILHSYFVLFRAVHKCSNVPSANEFTQMIQKKGIGWQSWKCFACTSSFIKLCLMSQRFKRNKVRWEQLANYGSCPIIALPHQFWSIFFSFGSLQLASSRLVLSTLSSLCPLFSNQRCWYISATLK